ncbi:hypothetical protein ACTWP5_10925 [Streptomyces sp. 4N509B]|uniref:hypothetical protein n=1 Tax=Streptomyces sp. 4N509B TaxID=3457413 RepID=UPI003FD29CF5
METEDASARPTPEQARAALDEAERAAATAAALSATPWQRWFLVTLTLFIAALPPVYGGMVASPEWLMPNVAWTVLMLVMLVAYVAAFRVAAVRWQERTGVALRFDVLGRRLTVPLLVGLPLLLLGSPLLFRVTDEPLWLLAGSVLGAGVSVGFHLVFVHKHRTAAPAT